MKHKISVTQIIRHIIQIAAFFILPGLFVLTYGAIKSIVMGIASGSFVFSEHANEMVIILAVIPVTILFGRFFCGFLCSFGALGDLMYFISGLFMKKRPKISRNVDRALKYVKYAVLILIVIFVWILGIEVEDSMNPWSVFGLFSDVSGLPSVRVVPVVGLVILIALMAASLFIERFFCRYLCPLGALFALISRVRLFKIKRKPSRCPGCGACDRKCSMGIAVSSAEEVKSGECIVCMKCVDACPTAALTTNAKPVLAGTVTAAAIAGVYIAGTAIVNRGSSSEAVPATEVYTGAKAVPYGENKAPARSTQTGDDTVSAGNTQTGDDTVSAGSTQTGDDIASGGGAKNGENKASSENVQSDILNGKYKDGVYRGTGIGFRGEIEVEVTVQGGNITDIAVISQREDGQFFNRAYDGVSEDIISSQSTDVDTVSGATFSSEGIIEAVADALSGAALSAESSSNGTAADGSSTYDSAADRNSLFESEGGTEYGGNSNLADTESGEKTAPSGTEEVGDTGLSDTENNGNTGLSDEEKKELSEMIGEENITDLPDGTYTGTGTGFRGDVTVSVTVESGKITDITVLSYRDDGPYFSRAESGVIEEIISEQSTDVDAVSGATFSSNGILEAVADALNITFENPNDSMSNERGGHGGGPGGHGGGPGGWFS
ncbi:MAG: FMN-binding protein [Eubacterium sp.]|nr:FMN-binding protein [Eubacterium sp.]